MIPCGAKRREELQAAPTNETLERRLSDADKLFAAPTPADFAPTPAFTRI
jgi:hypothetical protein